MKHKANISRSLVYTSLIITCEIGESKKHPLVREPGHKSRFETTTKEVNYLHNATPCKLRRIGAHSK